MWSFNIIIRRYQILSSYQDTSEKVKKHFEARAIHFSDMIDSIVYYFAYVCNMASSVRNKRKIEEYEIIEGDCYIKDYALTFDYYGLPLIEPSFGNIQPSKGCEVHGIVIKMPYKDFMSKIVATEGIDYQVIAVKCGDTNCLTLHNPRPNNLEHQVKDI